MDGLTAGYFLNAELAKGYVEESDWPICEAVARLLDRREISLCASRPIPQKESERQKRRLVPFEMTLVASRTKRLVSGGLGGGRKDAVEAEVHGLGGIVIGPGAGEDEHDAGAGKVAAAKKRDLVGEMGIVEFSESGGAKIE
jgi:hypothetical protein